MKSSPIMMMMMTFVSPRLLVVLFLIFINNNNNNQRILRIPGLSDWCCFLLWPERTQRRHPTTTIRIEKRRGDVRVFAAAFSLNVLPPEASSSLVSTTASATATAALAARRRDFLARLLIGGSVVVTTTTSTVTTLPPPAAAYAAMTALPPSVEADFIRNSSSSSSISSNTTTTSAAQLVMVSKGGRKFGALASRIRAMGHIMDELQRDLMQERWDLVGPYPTQLRSYVPVLTTYTDSAFPTDDAVDKGLRVALRYEVGRFFAALERFKQASVRKSLDEAYIAYSEMSLHLDRYMRVGGVYTYYDDVITLEKYFTNIPDDTLVFANRKKDPPFVRDLVVLVAGPEKGKTGILIGLYQDGSDQSVVKLDRYKGMREIRLVPNGWVAKRLGEQAPDDVFLIPRSSSSNNSVGTTSK